MAAKKRISYKSKKVSVGEQMLTLYSIDGHTWSSRKEELLEIQERHLAERLNFGGEIKGGQAAKEVAQKRREERQKKAVERQEKLKADKKKTKKISNQKPANKETAIKIKPKAKETAKSKAKPAPKKRASSKAKKKKTSTKKKIA